MIAAKKKAIIKPKKPEAIVKPELIKIPSKIKYKYSDDLYISKKRNSNKFYPHINLILQDISKRDLTTWNRWHLGTCLKISHLINK